MSLVDKNTLTLNHDTVVSIVGKYLTKLFSPEMDAVGILDLSYDEQGDGVRVEFAPKVIATKDPLPDQIRDLCLDRYCQQCDADAGTPCVGAECDFAIPGIHDARILDTFRADIQF